MTPSDKLREFGQKVMREYGRWWGVEAKDADKFVSDLTALISEHYVAKEEADKMVEWISVKDKLPEEHEDVLCYNGYRISSHNWCKYTDQDDKWFERTFTHWCKLPNIPKP